MTTDIDALLKDYSPSALDVLAAKVALSRSPEDFTVELGGRLDWSPKSNWVEAEGGLPKFVEDVAIGIMKSGVPREKAIQYALGKMYDWSRGGDNVHPDTVAKAAAALAQWNKMRASAKAKRDKRGK